jgi:hypothetical protein
MHYIYLSTAKLLYLITHFQKTYLKLNRDYFPLAGYYSPLQHMRNTEKVLKVTKLKPTLSRLRLGFEHNKHVLRQLCELCSLLRPCNFLENYKHFALFYMSFHLTDIRHF